MIKKAVRSWSGVLVVTVVMKPDKFSCTHNCAYCPNEMIKNGGNYDMPRSYLSTEPAVMRAMECDFDAVRQVHKRLDQLKQLGHTIDKLEIIVLGGTFSEYPRSYAQDFMTDLFYAANTYGQVSPIKRSTVLEEQKINVTTKHKIIGISIETRPDSICKRELRRLRMYGVTRVQIGIQHTDDEILDGINRGHTAADGEHAILQLKYNGFKVDVHVMPDLPGSTPVKDILMLKHVILGKGYSPDYMKIYPCLDVEHTEIRKWKQTGSWTPYSETSYDDLLNVIMYAKLICPEYIRFNRIQRDFPEEKPERIGFSSKSIKSNLRQMVQNECRKKGISCRCIRCREVKNASFKKVRYKIQSYVASCGLEYFVSANTEDDKLLGFVRLRMNDDKRYCYFEEIKYSGMIRELHVYGTVTKEGVPGLHVQHKGIGRTLLMFAYVLTYAHNLNSMAVISGVGARGYYTRFGFTTRVPYGYMTVGLNFWSFISNFIKILIFYNVYDILREVVSILSRSFEIYPSKQTKGVA